VGEFAAVEGVAVEAVGGGVANVGAAVFDDEAVVGFVVGAGRGGVMVVVEVGGVEVAEAGFHVDGLLVTWGMDGGAVDDKFDGDEVAEEVGGFLGEVAFAGGVDAEAAGAAAARTGGDGFEDAAEAVAGDLRLAFFPEEDEDLDAVGAALLGDGEGAGVAGGAGGGGDVEAEADGAIAEVLASCLLRRPSGQAACNSRA
jgi:hypothetical protein